MPSEDNSEGCYKHAAPKYKRCCSWTGGRDPFRPCLGYEHGASSTSPASPVLSASSPVRLRQVSQARPARIPGQRGTCLWCRKTSGIVGPTVCLQPQVKTAASREHQAFIVRLSTVCMLPGTSVRSKFCKVHSPRHLTRQGSDAPHLEACGPFCRMACRLGSQLVGALAVLEQPAEVGLKGPPVLGRIFHAARVEEVTRAG